MSAVSNVTGQVTLNLSSTFNLTSGVLSNYSIPGNIQINGAAGTLINGNGTALNIDLAAWGQASLASTTDAISFAALADPGGTSRNWEGGRIRLFAVAVLSTTSGYDLEMYASASNGVIFLPPVANPLYCRAGATIMPVWDPISNGGGVGNVITASTFALTFNSGSNTVVFQWLALGNSVA